MVIGIDVDHPCPLRPISGVTSIRSKPAGGDVVVELDARIAAQVAGDELGERLADDQADRLVLVALDQRLERGLDPLEGVLDGLAQRGADGQRVVEPLAEDPQVPALDLVDLEALPEPLVEVAEVVDPLGAQAEGLADGLGGADDALARPAIEGGEGDAVERGGEARRRAGRPRRGRGR